MKLISACNQRASSVCRGKRRKFNGLQDRWREPNGPRASRLGKFCRPVTAAKAIAAGFVWPLLAGNARASVEAAPLVVPLGSDGEPIR